jgi:predicted transcriptional regulator
MFLDQDEMKILGEYQRRNIGIDHVLMIQTLSTVIEYEHFAVTIESLVEKGYLKVRENNMFALTEKGFHFINPERVEGGVVKMSIEEMKKNRYLFLKKLYDATQGVSSKIINLWELGDSLSFDRTLTKLVYQYLQGEDLIVVRALGGGISITHTGVVEIENAETNPESPTEHFLPIQNIFNISNVYGSQLQVGSHNSTQTVSVEQNDIHEWIKQVEENATTSGLDAADIEVLKDEVEQLKLLLKARRPDKSILERFVQNIGEIFRKAKDSEVVRAIISNIPLIVETIKAF